MSTPEFVRTEVRPVTPHGDTDRHRLTPDRRTLLLDFGRELHGEFVARVGAVGARPTRIRVSLGESAPEAVCGKFADRTLPVTGGQELRLGPTGFRFAWLELVGGGGVEVLSPHAAAIGRPLHRRVAFRSADARLNAVWEVGARTVELCMQAHVWDGIKRGRGVWAGDLYPAAAVIGTLFGEHPVVPASLDRLRDQVFAGGAVDGWVNGIPAYTLWWLIVQRDWLRAHRNRGYAGDQRGFLLALVPLLCAGVGPDGRECLGDGWRFLDWASRGDEPAVHAGYQGLLKLGLDAAADLCDALGEDDAAARCRRAADHLVGWEPPERSKQAWALMSLAGLVDACRARAVLAADRPGGLTPFLGYVVLEALAALGEVAAGVELVRWYWGSMIDLGATTFWEDFDPAWGSGATGIDRPVPAGGVGVHERFDRCSFAGVSQSLCHAWSAGPTAWLSRHLGSGA
jgi:alpha-L-rhamnosidase